jgi:hypothetical protein
VIAQDALLSSLADHVAAVLHVDLPELAACSGMAGRFALDELQRRGSRVPAVHVSLLGAKTRDLRAGTFPRFDVSMAAYVVTGPQQGRDRDGDALAICQRLLARVEAEDWGLCEQGVQAAEKTALQSLITAAVRDAAASLWAVTWTQPILIRPMPEAVPMEAELYVRPAVRGVAPGGAP